MSIPRPTRVLTAKIVVLGFAVLIAIACWVAVLIVTDVDQDQQLQQAESRAGNLALTFEEQVYRQVLSIDQTLRSVKIDWERDPSGFDVAALQRRNTSISDLISGLMLLDPRGRVVSATRPGLVGSDLSGRRFFTAHRTSDGIGALITGPFQLNGAWYLSISRRVNALHGAFAGVVVASYDLDALMRDMSQADLGPRGLVMLVGRDGLVRAQSLRGIQEPGADISASPLYHAVFNGLETYWVGPSGRDGDVRIHAWRAIPGQDMTLVVGLDRSASLVPASIRKQQALLGASAVTLLILLLALVVGTMIANAAARVHRMGKDREVLQAANRELAKARELAVETSQQLGMTLAGMSDGISMVDAGLRLVQWNAQFATLVGVPHEALRRGLPLADILRLQAQSRELAPDLAEAEVSRELALAEAEDWPSVAIEQRANGTVLELRRTRLPAGGWVTLYSDITARKQAEDAQSRAREQAELAAQEKSRFVAIVSHEIRTPLNVALNSLGLLDGSHLSAAQRQWVETGLLAGESLLGLLNDILDLSRMQVGRLQLRPAPFVLRPLLEGVIDMFQHQALERGVELSVHVAANIPERLMTDSGRLRQALMNLVNNAAKFAEPGPASIHVNFTTMAGERVLRFAVRDCGPEIPDLDRARLFRPFSQLERPGSAGTGLGLAICQLLSNLLGGHIGCDRTQDGGKEFWLTLPSDVMDVPPEPMPQPGVRVAPEWLPRTRILLVEDVVANQMIVATMLRREGHMVDVASSGLEALAKVRSNAYDLVFLDIFMPGIDGLETARRIRALPGVSPLLPIVAVTANVTATDRATYLAAGMNDLVGKPVQRSTLTAALARHVWAGRRTRTSSGPRAAAMPEGAAIDPARVATWRKGLRASVSAELFADCVRQLHGMLPALHAALGAQNQAGVRQATHAIVGVAANYGLASLEALARSFGTGAAALTPDDALVRFRREIDRAEAAFQELDEVEAA